MFEQERKFTFKKGIDTDHNRRIRKELTLNTRKQRRHDGLKKRRNLNERDGVVVDEDVFSVLSGFMKGDLTQAGECLVKLRRLSSLEYNPPLDAIVENSNALAKVATFLDSSDPGVQNEASWLITNISAGNARHTLSIVEVPGLLRSLVKYAKDDEPTLAYQCIWALGNIAGDSVEHRDNILEQGGMSSILSALEKHPSNDEVLSHSIWAISNLCRQNSVVIYECIPVLCKHFELFLNNNVIADICWGLSYITTNNEDACTEVMKYMSIYRIVDLLKGNISAIQLPAIRVLGNLASGTNVETGYLLGFDLIKSLTNIIRTSERKDVLKECYWTLSNLTTVPKALDQIIEFKTLEIMIPYYHKVNSLIKHEMGYVIANFATISDVNQINHFISVGGMKLMFECMTDNISDQLVLFMLSALTSILAIGTQEANGGPNPFSLQLESSGGLTVLEALQEHKNEDIYNDAINLLEKFFVDAEDETPAPVLHTPAFTNWGPALTSGQLTFSF